MRLRPARGSSGGRDGGVAVGLEATVEVKVAVGGSGVAVGTEMAVATEVALGGGVGLGGKVITGGRGGTAVRVPATRVARSSDEGISAARLHAARAAQGMKIRVSRYLILMG